MKKELDYSEQLVEEGFATFGDIERLEKDELLFNEEVFKYLFSIESHILREKTITRLQMRAKELKVYTQFNKILKAYEEEQKKEYIYDDSTIVFDGLEVDNLTTNVFKTNRFQLESNGQINEVVPKIGKFLVCYHPIVPVEKFKNYEDGTEKVKLAYFINGAWNYIVVDKSMIASPQSIIKLSDVGIAVTSETAKYLIKYLAEIENMNRDIIKTNISVSRLGWIDGKLIPYSKKYQFDNEKDFPKVYERFEERGSLEEWTEFFRERRKYNDISRIIMAGAVSSIFLKELKQSGFTIHIWRRIRIWKKCFMYGWSVYIW